MKIFYKPDQDGSFDSDEDELIRIDEVDQIVESSSESQSNVLSAEDSDESFDADEAYSDSDQDIEEDIEDSTAIDHPVGGPSVENASSSNLMDDDADDDEVLQRIVAETKKERDHPPDIKTEDFIFHICFHPNENLLAVGTFTGDVIMYKYSNNENTIVNTFEVHTKPVRKIAFDEDGDILLSVSKDKSIMLTDVGTGKLRQFFENAHEHPIYSLYVLNQHIFATGDDDGMLKVWDSRITNNSLFSIKIVEDYISQIISNDAQKLLISSSGDGYLTSVNFAQRKIYVQSEPYEEEFNSMGLFRDDSKLIVGTSKGNLYTFNWGEFGLHSDKFPGPNTDINCMVPITNRIACVSGEEGVIRATHVVPGRNLGIVGQHSLGIETMDICNSGEFIASGSHDNDIRFWNIKYFEDFDDIKYNAKPDEVKAKRNNLPSSRNVNASDFFADL